MDNQNLQTKYEFLLNSREKQIKNLQNQVYDLQQKNLNLSNDIKIQTKTIKEKENIINELQLTIQKFKSDMLYKDNTFTQMTKEIQLYENILKSNYNRLSVQDRAIFETQSSYQTLVLENITLDKDKRTLQTEKNLLENIQKQLEKNEQFSKAWIQSLLCDYNSIMEKFKASNAELTNINKTLQGKNIQLTEQLKSSNEQCDDLLIKNRLLEEKFAKQERDYNIYIGGYIQEIKQFTEKINIYTNQIKTLEDNIQELQTNSLKIQQEKNIEIDKIRYELEAKTLQNHNNELEIENLKQELKDLHELQNDIEKEIINWNNKNNNIDITDNNTILNMIQNAIHGYITEKAKNEKLNKTIMIVKNEFKEKIPTLIQKNNEMLDLIDQNAKLNEKLENLNQNYKLLLESKNNIQEQYNLRNSACEKSNFENEFLTKQISKLLFTLHKLKSYMIQKFGSIDFSSLINQETNTEDDNIFYSDINSMHERYMILLNRLRELKMQKDKINITSKEIINTGDIIDTNSDLNEQTKDINMPMQNSEQYEIKIKTLQDELNKHDSYEKELLKKINSLEKDIMSLNQKNQVLLIDVQKSKLFYERAYLAEEMKLNMQEFQEKEIKRLNKEREDLNKQILEKNKEINEVKNFRLQEFKIQITKLNHTIDCLNNELNERKKIEDIINEAIKKNQNIIIEKSIPPVDNTLILKAKIENQQAIIMNYENRIKYYKANLEDLNLHFKESINKLSKMLIISNNRQDYHSTIEEVLNLRQNLEEVKEQLVLYRNELDSKKIDYQNLFKKVENMTSQISEKIASLKERHESENKIFQEEMKKISNKYEEEIRNVSARKERVEELIILEEEHQDQNQDNWKEKYEEYKALYEETRKELFNEREANLALKEQHQYELNNLRKVILNIDEYLKHSTNQELKIIELTQIIESKDNIIKDLEKNFNEYIEMLTKERDTLKEENQKLVNDYHNVLNQKIIENDENILEQKSNLFGYIREKNISLSVEIHNLQSKIFALKDQIVKLRSSKDEIIINYKKENLQLKSSIKEYVPLASRLKDIMDENKLLKEENIKNKKDSETREKVLNEQEYLINQLQENKKFDEDQDIPASPGSEDIEKIINLLERVKYLESLRSFE